MISLKYVIKITMNIYMCREDKENLAWGGGGRVGNGAEAEAGAAVEGGSGNVHAVEVGISWSTIW